MPCGLCHSHRHGKNRSESHMSQKKSDLGDICLQYEHSLSASSTGYTVSQNKPSDGVQQKCSLQSGRHSGKGMDVSCVWGWRGGNSRLLYFNKWSTKKRPFSKADPVADNYVMELWMGQQIRQHHAFKQNMHPLFLRFQTRGPNSINRYLLMEEKKCSMYEDTVGSSILDFTNTALFLLKSIVALL